MKRWIAGVAAMLCLSTQLIAQEDYATRAKRYVDKYKALAMEEQKRSGVPAAITLAQGIHETSAGASPLSVEANNHFGIKCKKNWTGDAYTHTDDAPNECFRKYGSPEDSYKDHSDYLKTTPRYASLFQLSTTDYAAWAMGLKKAGYATNPRYAQMLIKLIEEYRLQEYTYAALDNDPLNKTVAEVVPEEDAKPVEKPLGKEEPSWAVGANSNIIVAELPAGVEEASIPEMTPKAATSFPPYGKVVKVNGLKAVYAKKGDMPLEYAIAHNVRYERLLEINEITDRPLSSDMYVYLERKRFKGLRTRHKVAAGETMAGIAQHEGMQLKALRTLNHLEDGEEPAEGAVLYLQQEAPKKPLLAGTTNPAEPPTVIAPQEEIAAKAPAQPSEFISKEEINGGEPTENELPEPVTQVVVQTETGPATVFVTSVGPENAVETTKPVTTAGPDPSPALPPAPAEKQVATKQTSGTPTVEPPVNIANEKPVEEEIAAAKAKPNDEPVDELAALKAKFDKVVYAPKTAEQPVVTTEVPAEPGAVPAEEAPAPKQEEVKTIPVSGPKFYLVKKGDTAFSIAKRNNITVKELMDWNNLTFEGIKVGQRLRIKQ